MQRRAHGGAWGAAALLIGSCTFVEAGEPIPKLILVQAPAHYSSGAVFQNSASQNSVAPFSASAPVAASGISSFTAARAATSPTVVPPLDILPTPIVPSAAALSQSSTGYPGNHFAPSTVANLSPDANQPTAGQISGQVISPGPMVPLNLSPQEKELLEKALRGPSSPASKENSADAKTSAEEKPVQVEKKPVPVEKPAQVEKTAEKTSDLAKPEKKVAPPAKARTAQERLSDDAANDSADESVAAIELHAAVAKPAESGETAITPLPPVEREVPGPVPAPLRVPLNLPQPPIPLEFPRTGR